MRRRRSLLSTDESTKDVWPSFTDVTSTIALILFVLVLLAYVKNLISGKCLLAFQQQIATSEQRLRTLEDDLTRTAAEIEAGKARLQASDDRVKAQDDVIAASGRELDALRARLQSIAVLRVDVLDKVKRSI